MVDELESDEKHIFLLSLTHFKLRKRKKKKTDAEKEAVQHNYELTGHVRKFLPLKMTGPAD